MEIRYLKQEEKEQSRGLYEEVFVEDEKAFVDAYYSVKACDNRILTAWEEGKPVSMLHRNPYTYPLRLPPPGAYASPAYTGASGYGEGKTSFYFSDACG